ncbi:MAG: orotidine-5'-phosphate decarboxylase [Bacteroidetes bacterium]|nr:orotidine-5'-phosphate decarboxylase [Bacteroidota bacterium]
MNYSQITEHILDKKNYLCVGLDTDTTKLPAHLKNTPDGVITFNKAIIEATKDYCVSYKVNTAFYEARGKQGWEELEETFKLIPDTHFKIADAKRADIGNTSEQYARAFFEYMKADAVTVSPYMGLDCLEPFFAYENKFTIVLALTSNPGSIDFEQGDFGGRKLYESVLVKTAEKADKNKAMFVVGATKAETLGVIRKLIPEHYILVPGVGSQGGSLSAVSQFGMNESVGLLVNNSRQIIYASSGEDFAEAAAKQAKINADEMKLYIA